MVNKRGIEVNTEKIIAIKEIKIPTYHKVPVNYVFNILTNTEMNYLEVEKYLTALVVFTRKFHPYFDEHEITVLTNQPLKGCLS